MNSKSGLIFRAIPDCGRIQIVPNGKGGVQAIWPNCSVLPTNIYKNLEARANTLWYPQKEDTTQDSVSWIVNMCADADEYASALKALEEMVEGTNVPVFNHPKAVAATRRDLISQSLQGIPNLIVPQCVRFLADSPEKFEEVFQENNFEYPVLIRPGASQTGRNLVKVDREDDWGKVHTIPWGGKHLYMTQFIDFASDDGMYEKIRMVFVNNKILFRSLFRSDRWNVHGVSRTKESVQKELQFHKKSADQKPLMKILADIQERIKLDFWGVDLGCAPDGRYVFFEANAAMTIAVDENTPTNVLGLMQPIFSPVATHLKNSMLTPKGWRNS